MGILTLKEEIILSAIWMLGGSSHGAAVRDKVVELSQKEIVYGTLYNSLEYLIGKGYVSTSKSEPLPEKGGKSKTIYNITPEGISAVEETKKLHENIWKELPGFEMGTAK
jgi:DNA-binding PadR family transcriptional regulator